MRTLLTSLLILVLSGAASASPSASELSVEAQARFDRMRTATAALSSYTYTFRREEWADGKQQDPNLMAVKFRRPMDIYMKWVGQVHKGRELLYRQGWNDGDMKVKPGALLPTLNLDPAGRLAMHGSRHGVDLIDLSRVVGIITSQTDRIAANNALSATYTDLGPALVGAEAAHCLRADLPKDQDPGLYAVRIDICTSDQTGLLVRLRTWDVEDGQLRKVEDYEFRDITVVPLADSDFDPDNPEYGF
ncbi:MAG: DUF1571 domain-containing protein [Oligoflexia bacterium]|nr:DUF1571 domain-containing protein [Oligoflexia bacterium]